MSDRQPTEKEYGELFRKKGQICVSFKCRICGPKFSFDTLWRLEDHMRIHFMHELFECDLCPIRKTNGKFKNRWFCTRESAMNHYNKKHRVKRRALQRGTDLEKQLLKDIESPKPIEQCSLPEGVDFDSILVVNGRRRKELLELRGVRKVKATVPASAPDHSRTKFYLVEWMEKDKHGKYVITKEPAESIFTETGGSTFIKKFWAAKNVEFDHFSLHYGEKDGFQYLNDADYKEIIENEAAKSSFWKSESEVEDMETEEEDSDDERPRKKGKQSNPFIITEAEQSGDDESESDEDEEEEDESEQEGVSDEEESESSDEEEEESESSESDEE